MFDLKIDLITTPSISDLEIKDFVITINGTEHAYGGFVLHDLDETIEILKHCCTHSNIFPHLTFAEVIQVCDFFTDEEKEYCKLKYV